MANPFDNCAKLRTFWKSIQQASTFQEKQNFNTKFSPESLIVQLKMQSAQKIVLGSKLAELVLGSTFA